MALFRSNEITETVGGPILGDGRVKITCRNVNVYYGEKQAIKNVSVDIAEKEVTAFIGPSGCGKSTFLRCLKRMNDTIKGTRIEGEIRLDGEDIYDRSMDPVLLRARIGMVFQGSSERAVFRRSPLRGYLGPS